MSRTLLGWYLVAVFFVFFFILMSFLGSAPGTTVQDVKLISFGVDTRANEQQLKDLLKDEWTYLGTISPGTTDGKIPTQVAFSKKISASPSGIRTWYDVVRDVLTFMLQAFGILGLVILFCSLRASAYSQIYGRIQAIQKELLSRPSLYKDLATTEFKPIEEVMTEAEDNLKHRHLASMVMSLFEEIHSLYSRSGIPYWGIGRTMDEDSWKMWNRVLKPLFKLKYIETFWRYQDPTTGSFSNQEIYTEGFRKHVNEFLE